MITLVLAGGQGSRLFPLTKMRSKPAVPIGGRFRLIDFPISNCIHSDLRKIFVLTQFSSVSLHRHISLSYHFDSFTKDFITILSAQQTLKNRNWYQGTADAVRQNLSFLRKGDDLVLILSGDHLYRMDYRKFIDFHSERKADITIGVYPVPYDQAPEFGVMKVNPQGRIVDFKEKPKEPSLLDAMKVPESTFAGFNIPSEGRTHLASMGVYIFQREVLVDLLRKTDFQDFGREVIPNAMQSKNVYAYFFNGYWQDIGTIRSFFDAHIDLTQSVPKFNLYDEDKPFFSRARFLPGSKIIGTDVHNSILCEGSIINHSKIDQSIIGIRARIGDGSRLERVVMMGADFFESLENIDCCREQNVPAIGIGEGCEIRDCILDRNARIGNNVKLINSRRVVDETAENYSIVDGIIVIPKNAVIPDNTVI